MSTRWEVTRAVRTSDLPAPSRLIMFVLSDVAEVGTAEIPEQFTPSLTVLANETGLDRSTVRRHLSSLEDGGWVVRMRPDPVAARLNGERTRYRLTVPAVVAPVPQVGAPSPQVGAENPHPRGTVPPDLGAENTRPRGTVPLNNQILIKADPVAASPKPATAQTIMAAFIDHCAEKDVKIPRRLIGQYAKGIDDALREGFGENLIKRALASMLTDNALNRPSLLPNRIVATQTGPERWPKRINGFEAPSNAPTAIPADQRCPKHRGELARNCRRCAAHAKARPQEKAS